MPTLTLWLLPMLNHLVIRSPAKEMDVAEEAVHTLRAVAARLPWRAYLASLLGLTRLLRLQPSLEKRLVRALVAVLDVFHFDISQEEERPALAARREAQDGDQPKLSLGAAALRRAEATGLRGAGPEQSVSVGASATKASEREGEEGEEGEGGEEGEEGEEAAVPETAAEITASAAAAAAAAAATPSPGAARAEQRKHMRERAREARQR